MKIAITGASGFIGTSLSHHLVDNGFDVLALVRSPEKARIFDGKELDIGVCDVTDPDSLSTAFQGIQVVIHLAALFNNPEASWEAYHSVNVIGTKNVLEAAMKCGVQRVLHCSTIGVAIGVGSPPYSEKTPYSPPPWDKYETTKCEGEKLAIDFCRMHRLPVVVIRPAQVYGPGDVSKAKFYRMVKKGIIVNPGNTLRHLIYIDDLCRAFIIAVTSEKAVGEVFIIGGERAIPLKELVELAAQEIGVSPPKITLPVTPITWLCAATENICQILKIKPPLFRRSMDFFTKSVEFDVAKAATHLGFSSQVNIPTGVARTVAWYRENGLI